MHGVHFRLLLAKSEAMNAKQRILLDRSWIEIADILPSIVLHKPLTPQISAWSSPLSKIQSSTMHWQIQAYCEPSSSQHA